MVGLIGRALVVTVLGVAASQTNGSEVVFRPKQVIVKDPGVGGDGSEVVRGNLGRMDLGKACSDCGWYTRPLAAPRAGVPDDIFSVYRTDEVDGLLNTTRIEINRSIDEKESVLRLEIKDAVTASLAALPSRLFSDEVKVKLENDLYAQVQALLTERTSAIRDEIKSDFEARLSALESRLNELH
jgi:hypothetical protein